MQKKSQFLRSRGLVPVPPNDASENVKSFHYFDWKFTSLSTFHLLINDFFYKLYVPYSSGYLFEESEDETRTRTASPNVLPKAPSDSKNPLLEL